MSLILHHANKTREIIFIQELHRKGQSVDTDEKYLELSGVQSLYWDI